MNNKDFIKLVEDDFNVHEDESGIELETWTDGGVNMIITLHMEKDKSYYEQFAEYIEDFDIDEEIELHREDDRYKSAFTIRESVEDFEEFEESLKVFLADC